MTFLDVVAPMLRLESESLGTSQPCQHQLKSVSCDDSSFMEAQCQITEILFEENWGSTGLCTCMSLCRPSVFSLLQLVAFGKGGAHICHNVVTKQKPVMDVCFLVCIVPPFLPLTVALGLTLSENFHSWHPPVSPPPLQPVACSAVLGHKPHFP